MRVAYLVLAACSIPTTQFQPSVDGSTNPGSGSAAIDAPISNGAQIVADQTAVTIDEGKSGGFTVTLAAAPTNQVIVDVASTDASALPASPAMLTFDDTDFSTPQMVTLSPPVDVNNVGETATITLTSVGLATTSVAAQVHDLTQIDTYGWPTAFTDTTDIDPGTVIGYQVSLTTTSNLASFGTYIPAAAGDFRMALYDDSSNTPNNLIASMPLRQTLVNGANVATLTTPPSVDNGLYWLMIRVSASTAIGMASSSQTGPQCYRDVNIANLDDPWPTTFGAASCATAPLMNLSMTTYYQAQ
ncbi:MAG TPA: hypothetical protein VH143_01135 [Kofleriaceae bacterium]|jgi:hypothetical protein|nr:hypothetical protein [Kofleriaceae bacterium]